MLDAAPGADVLHAARRHDAVVPERIAMFELAAEHVGDDLHVAVWVRPEALPRLHRVVVEDAQRAPVEVLGIVVAGKAVRMVRLEPAEVEEGPVTGTLHGEDGLGLGSHRPLSDPSRARRVPPVSPVRELSP